MSRSPTPLPFRVCLVLLLLGILGAVFWFYPPSHGPQKSVTTTSPSSDPASLALSPVQQGTDATQATPLAAASQNPVPTPIPLDSIQGPTRLDKGAPTPAAIKTAGQDLRAGRPFQIMENGLASRYRLALDEIYDSKAEVHERLRKIPPQATAGDLLQFAQAQADQSGKWPGLIIYPQDGPVDEAHRRVLTSRVLLKTEDATQAEKAAASQGLEFRSRPTYAPEFVITDAPSPVQALDAMAALADQPVIASAEPLLMRQRVSRAIQDDVYYQDQWHLHNTGQSGGKKGLDIGIESVWDELQGDNIRIAIVDDGLQLTHPDLAPNVDTAPNHYDWNGEDTNPAPSPGHDFHGTAVGGLVGARGNNFVGVSGVAPRATLVGYRLIAGVVNDEMEADAVTRGADVIHIKNNSWGMSGGAYDLGHTGALFSSSMAFAAETGRGGRGTISVWSAGNGRHLGMQGNKDGYANSMYGIAVGAVSHTGTLAFYSETGSHICVVAPSIDKKGGMVTTDLVGVDGYNKGSIKNLSEVDYTNDFGGTSAAAPIVSGVVALMLQANPTLGWRDVKEILLRSSVKLQPKDADWVEKPNRDPWELSFAPIKHHHFFGGGLVNAPAAVAMARNWTNLGEMQLASLSQAAPEKVGGDRIAPAGGTTIILPEETKPKFKSTRLEVDFGSAAALRVEHVNVTVSATHNRKGDFTLRLISPSGSVSTLATFSKLDTGKDYPSWTFSSVRHWGESSRGKWTVVASEPDDDINGELLNASITLYGTSYPAIQLTQVPETQVVAEGSNAGFTGLTTVQGKTTRQWLKNGKAIPGATNNSLSFNPVQLTDAANYTYTAENLTAQIEVPVAMGVVRMAVPDQHVLLGRTATFKVVAAGPALRYQWFTGSTALRDDDRLTGTRSAILTLRRTTYDDASNYYCRVSTGNASLNTQQASLVITIPPDLDTFTAPEDGIVSGYINFPILAANGATQFTAKGLPPGLKLDAKTGRITGRPTRPGLYRVTISASNAAGKATPVTFDWNVGDLPAGTLGNHRGLVERNALYNRNYGGTFVLTVAKTGTFTGNLTRGATRTAFKGVLDAHPGDTYSTAALSLPGLVPGTTVALNISLENGYLEGTLGPDDETAVRVWAQQEWTSLPTSLAGMTGQYNVPLIPTAATTLALPQGSGFVSVNLQASGQITYTGRLADGTPFTGGGKGTLDNVLPVHHLLYKGTGSLQGQFDITQGPPFTGISAAVDWFKSPQPAQPVSRNYRDGFALHDLAGQGQRYQPPGPGSLILGLPLTTGNTRLFFSEGGLFQPFTQSLTLLSGNIAQFPVGSSNPHQLKLAVNAKNGLLTGSGTAMDIDPANPLLNRQRPGTYFGLLIQGLDRAEGFFLLPSNTSPLSPIHSGRFVLRSSALAD